MIEKTINVGNVELRLKSSGSLLRRYKDKFGRDLLKDINNLSGNTDTDIIENILYVMNKFADPSQPDDMYEWLDQFDGALDLIIKADEITEMIETEFLSQSTSKKK